jgi:hypothetical protein
MPDTDRLLEVIRLLEADKVKKTSAIKQLELDKKRLVDRLVDNHYYGSLQLQDILEPE